MTDDLVERLRDMCGRDGILAIRDIYDHDVAEAADRIEKLEAALREIANMHELSVSDYNGMWWTYQRVARKALEEKDG